MSTETTTVHEHVVWIYAGRRRMTKSGVVYAWLDHEGNERYFKKSLVTGAYPGQSFNVVWEPNGNGGGTLIGRPRFVKMVNHEKVPEWEALDTAIGVELAAVRHQKKAAEDAEMKKALDVLRVRYQGLVRWDDQSAFMAFVMAQLNRAV